MVQSDATAVITASGVSAWLINLLKNSEKIPWISNNTRTLNTAISAMLAVAASIGIGMTFDDTHGVLTITGLTLTGLLTGLYAALKSFVMNQLILHGVLSNNAGQGTAKNNP